MANGILSYLVIYFCSKVSANDIFDEQVRWLRSKDGFFNDKIRFRPVEGNKSVNGFFAVSSIQRNEKVMVIPAAAQILVNPNQDYCDMVRNLANEYYLRNKSIYEPYVNFLFESSPHQHLPSAWSDNAKDLIANIVGNELEPQFFGETSFAFECGSDGNEKDDEVLEAAWRIFMIYSWQDKLVPILGMMNHRNGKFHNVDQLQPSQSSKEISMIALRDIEEGEQLYISYNECSSLECKEIRHTYTLPQMFADYGFVEEYPRRFNFDTSQNMLTFELDVDSDGIFQLNWLSNPPTVFDTNWLRGHALRLNQLNATVLDGIAKLAMHEKMSIL